MVNTLREEKQMKEFQITYNVWGTYSDNLLVGSGSVFAHDESEALLRATLDLVKYGKVNPLMM